jgi:hypothetical protein
VRVYELSASREDLTRRAGLDSFLNVYRDAPADITEHGAEHNLRRADMDEVEVAVIQNQRTAFSLVLPKFFGGLVDLSSNPYVRIKKAPCPVVVNETGVLRKFFYFEPKNAALE